MPPGPRCRILNEDQTLLQFSTKQTSTPLQKTPEFLFIIIKWIPEENRHSKTAWLESTSFLWLAKSEIYELSFTVGESLWHNWGYWSAWWSVRYFRFNPTHRGPILALFCCHMQDVTLASSLSRVKLVWIQSFPSPRSVAKPKRKNPVCPTIHL